MQILIILILLITHQTTSLKESQKCRFDRVHKMIAYNCANLKLTAIPRNMKASTEILDASENRIKKLNKDSFGNYKKLKFLYLFDNIILKVEAGTFAKLELLETLDLSNNGLTVVPPEIFGLTSLRKLYLAENELHNEGFSIIKKPVKAPLVYLNIASTEIDKIPDLGILPELFYLNISLNILKQLAPEQFAPLCQIKHVDLNGTKVGGCQCVKINIFMEQELKRLPILDCGGTKPSNCISRSNSTVTEPKEYLICLNVKTELMKSRTSSAEISWPPVLFFGTIALLFIVMIFLHCQKKPTNRPQQIELISDVDAEITANPNTRHTLIM